MIQSAQSANPRQIKKPRSWVVRSSAILFILLVLSCISLKAQAEPEYKFFKGLVKTCREECFRAQENNGAISGNFHKRERKGEFDFEITYDSTGRKIAKSIFSTVPSVKRRITFIYDRNGLLREENVVSGLNVHIRTTYYSNELDSAGRLRRCVLDYSDGSSAIAYLYHYNPQGCSEYFFPKADFPQTQLLSREFDSSGNLVKYWSYTQSGKLIGSAELSYDSLGNKVQETVFDRTGVNYMTYKWKYKGSPHPERYEVCKPNSTSCESWTYKYEYDKTGNWIRCIEYRNGKPIYVKERTITYY